MHLLDQLGRTPLQLAMEGGRWELVELLRTRGAEIKNGVLQAAIKHDLDLAIALINSGVDVNDRNTKGQTPLHVAVEKGERDLVELLVAKGAAINVEDREGHTPLCLSSREIAEFLVEKGADVHFQNRKRQTPLFHAARRGALELVEFLIAL